MTNNPLEVTIHIGESKVRINTVAAEPIVVYNTSRVEGQDDKVLTAVEAKAREGKKPKYFGLTFAQLTDMNFRRCERLNAACGKDNGLESWSPTEWALAMAGKCGEACNLIKKTNTGDLIMATDIAHEIADMIIYADLLCQRMNVSLGEAVKEAFNNKSEELNLSEKL